jgi:hypothetical protein
MSDAKHHDEWQQHENVWLLLPWYANGTLEAAERTLVQEHLGGCSACRDELARCGGLAAALAAGPENAPSPHPIQLARLMERIEASERNPEGFDEEEGKPIAGGPAGARTPQAAGASAPEAAGASAPEAGLAAGAGRRRGVRASMLAATPVPMRWVLAGQVAALVALGLLAVTLAFGPARPGPRYKTLSAPSPAAVLPQVRLIFSETATVKEIRDVLLRTGGRLVDGPSPIGAYTLELPGPVTAAAAGAEREPSAASGTPGKPAAAGAGFGPETQSGAAPGSQAAAGPSPSGPRPAGPAAAAADSPDSILAYLRAQRIVRFAEPVAGAPWPAVAPGGGVSGSPGGSPP